jgi:rod shape-determining protein MreD
MSESKIGMGPIFMSFFIALMLMIVPLPEHVAWFRPQFAMLVLIYWILQLPHRIGVATGWCVGLLMDVLIGGVLGEYALGMSLIAYFTYRIHARLRMFPLVQQIFSVMVLVAVAQVLVTWINYLAGDPYKFYLHWLPIFTTALCWPLVYLILNSVQSHFAIE